MGGSAHKSGRGRETERVLSLSVKPACPWHTHTHTQSIDNGTNKNVKHSSGRADSRASFCSLRLCLLSWPVFVCVSVCCQRIKATAVCIEAHANKERGSKESSSMKTGIVGERWSQCVAAPP